MGTYVGFTATVGSSLGALLNPLPEWATKPYFALPENGVTFIAGETVTIYGDSLINVPIVNNLEVDYTCAIGTQSGNNLVLTTPAAGTYTCAINIKNNGLLIAEYNINISVISKVPNGAKKVMIVGDSTGLSTVTLSSIADVLQGVNLTFVGSNGTAPLQYESYGGITWGQFNTGVQGKFFKEGALNIPAFFVDNSVDIPDYIYIRLGINDIFGTESFETIISNAETLVNAFLSADSNYKILIGLPTIAENTGAGWLANYPTSSIEAMNQYIEDIHHYSKLLSENFANGQYNARVDCSYERLNLDRNDGYPKVDGVHSNGVHPAASGYEQIGSVIAAKLNKLMVDDYEITYPSGVTLTLISGGVKIDWVDNTLNEYQTEIYGKDDAGEYSLIATLDPGVVTYNDNDLTPVDLRYYKLRCKSGDTYTDYTAESSIALLSAEIVNQTTWCDVGLTFWNTKQEGWSGDGSKLIKSGSSNYVSKSSALVGGVGTRYRIKSTCTGTNGYYWVCDLSNYTGVDACSNGSYNKIWTKLTTSTLLGIYANNFSGEITALSVKRVLI